MRRPLSSPFPGSKRALTLPEVQELQTRLTKAGFDTDGRVGMKAVKGYQTRMGLLPAYGYCGLKVLAGSCLLIGLAFDLRSAPKADPTS